MSLLSCLSIVVLCFVCIVCIVYIVCLADFATFFDVAGVVLLVRAFVVVAMRTLPVFFSCSQLSVFA